MYRERERDWHNFKYTVYWYTYWYTDWHSCVHMCAVYTLAPAPPGIL